ncbi:MAG: hypothetical protein AB1938_13975 [Myxococcota bacterium]
MRRRLLLSRVGVVVLLAFSAAAQDVPVEATPHPPPSGAPGRFDLSAQLGWQVSPTMYFGRAVKLTDSGSFGGSFGGRVVGGWKQGHALRAELFYLFQPSGLSVSPVGTTSPLEYQFGLSIHYLQAAALYEVGNDRVRGFFSAGLGVTVMHPHDPSYRDAWLLGGTAALGIKLRLLAKFGVRAQARLLIPFFFTGSFWCVSAAGCAVNLTGGGALLQADFTAGPYFDFG